MTNYLININLRQLLIFYYVAKEASFSVASEKLFLTEPAIYQHVKSLEKTIGFKLFEVKRKKVYLTQVGDAIYNHAEKIYEQASEIETYLNAIKYNNLRVGISASFSSILAFAAASFEKDFPEIYLSLKAETSQNVIQGVIGGQYDIGIMAESHQAYPELKVSQISNRQRYILVTGRSTIIPTKKPLTLADFCDYPFLVPPNGSYTRELLFDKMKLEGFELKHPILLETAYTENVTAFTEATRCVAIVPEAVARYRLGKTKLRIIVLSDLIDIPIVAYTAFDMPIHKMANKFIDYVKRTFE